MCSIEKGNIILYGNLCEILTDLKNFSLDDFFSKFAVKWLLTTPPHLKYVATLPCNVSLIACFLTLVVHKVVWQNMQGVGD